MQCFQLISMHLQIQWCSGTRQPSAVAIMFKNIEKTKYDIIFIDLCGTLVKENTTFDFLKKNNYINTKSSIYIFLRILYKLTKIDILRKYIIYRLKGVNKDILIEQAKKYSNNCQYNQEVLDIITLLSKDDTLKILCTASLDFIAQSFSEKIDADNCYSTTLSYNDKVCNGFITDDLLDRKSSVILKNHNTTKKKAIMISDNFGDFELKKYDIDFIAISYSEKACQKWLSLGVKKIIRLSK